LMNRIAAFLIGVALATSALAQKISLVGGTAINPADGKIVQNAVVVINGDKIESIASRKESGVAVGSRWVECDGKFILRVYIDTPDQAREFVRKLVGQKPDLVKIWYIVDQDHPVDSFRPIARATIEESHAHKIRVAVHATELETARAAVEEGADVLVHSVIDKPVDDAFVKLLKDRHTILCPTLVVFERYGRTFANRLNLTPEERAWGNPEVIASLDVTKIPSDKLPERIKTALADPKAALDRIKKTYDVALPNLKKLEDSGVTI